MLVMVMVVRVIEELNGMHASGTSECFYIILSG